MATVTWLQASSLPLSLSRSDRERDSVSRAWPLTVTFTSLSRIRTLLQVAGLQVARCCLRCPNGIFGQRGVQRGTCCCCCCLWYLMLDFLSLMKCGYKCNFTFFKKHFICRRQARERRHNSQPRPAARDMQPCVCVLLCVCLVYWCCCCC